MTGTRILLGDSSLCLGEGLESCSGYKRGSAYECKSNRELYCLHKKMGGIYPWERNGRGKEEMWMTVRKKRAKTNASKIVGGWHTPWGEVAKNILKEKPKEKLRSGKSNIQLKIVDLLKCQSFLDVLRYSTKPTTHQRVGFL